MNTLLVGNVLFNLSKCLERKLSLPELHERDGNNDFAAILQNPRRKFKWTDDDFKANSKDLLIYEAHIGMAGEEEKVYKLPGGFSGYTSKPPKRENLQDFLEAFPRIPANKMLNEVGYSKTNLQNLRFASSPAPLER